jgi:hypothetical protein
LLTILAAYGMVLNREKFVFTVSEPDSLGHRTSAASHPLNVQVILFLHLLVSTMCVYKIYYSTAETVDDLHNINNNICILLR